MRKHDVTAALAVSQQDRRMRRELVLKDPMALDRAKHALELAERIGSEHHD